MELDESNVCAKVFNDNKDEEDKLGLAFKDIEQEDKMRLVHAHDRARGICPSG